MVKLIEEGKIRAVGVSNFTVDLLERCEAVRHVDSLQPPFSMINRNAGDKLLPWCKNQNTGVICYSPMQSGILTERFSAERVSNLASDDWRRRAAEFQEPKLSRNLALRDALKPDRRALRSIGLGAGHRLDARVARRHRSDCGSTYPGASRWMDSGGHTAIDTRRLGGNRRSDRPDRRGKRADTARESCGVGVLTRGRLCLSSSLRSE